jgi:hypothetical protein
VAGLRSEVKMVRGAFWAARTMAVGALIFAAFGTMLNRQRNEPPHGTKNHLRNIVQSAIVDCHYIGRNVVSRHGV